MKKFMFLAVTFAAVCLSCTKESFYDMEVREVPATQEVIMSSFDKESESLETFWLACKSIVEIHKEFDYFRALLSESQLEKIDKKSYSVDEAVGIIFAWYSNPETFDVMVEWPAWDDFYSLLPEKYFETYHFCF